MSSAQPPPQSTAVWRRRGRRRREVAASLLCIPVLGVAFVLSACGMSHRSRAHADAGACPALVASALGHVALRLYRESVSSDTTRAAQRLIERSAPLRDAAMRGDRTQAAVAVARLLATHHMVRLRVISRGRVLADVGPARVLSPLRGVLISPGGRQVGSYVASTQSADAYVSAVKGLTLAPAVITTNRQVVASSLPGSTPPPPLSGAFVFHGQRLANFSFPAQGFPGEALGIHVVPSFAYAARSCGASDRDTVRYLISGVLLRIYHFEASSGAAFAQVHRVQQNRPLLRAVARGDPSATKLAIIGLLNQHIVRLRVSAGPRLLGDVGGPYVLAPIARNLNASGRTIGHFVVSIQDDLGYLLLSRRLAHVALVMRRDGQTVMSALQPAPDKIPAQGPFRAHGRSYEVFSFTAEAFPSGPLQVFALIPFPYR